MRQWIVERKVADIFRVSTAETGLCCSPEVVQMSANSKLCSLNERRLDVAVSKPSTEKNRDDDRLPSMLL